MKKTNTTKRIITSDKLLDQLVAIESVLNKLPPLSTLEKIRLDQDRAIEHLYYSSKLEGTALTRERMDQAIYGKGLHAAWR